MNTAMDLGAFSVRLAVNDLAASRAVYQKLGFAFVTEADESRTGPVSFVIPDPDGNTILFDPHFGTR